MKIIYAVLLVAGFMLPGCYTILEHPDVSSKDENGFVYHDNVKFYDDCSSCHNSTDQALVSTNPSMYSTYRNHRAERSYYSDSYYSDSFFGDYGYYYNTPWWYNAAQSGSGNTQAKENNRSAARDNNGDARNENNEREVSRTRPESGRLNYTSPTRSSNGSGSSGSSTTTESTKPNSSDSSGNNTRSNSDAPKSRNNSGERSSGSRR